MDRRFPEEEKPGLRERTQAQGVVGTHLLVAGTQLFQRFTLRKSWPRGMSVVWLADDDRLERLVALNCRNRPVSILPLARI